MTEFILFQVARRRFGLELGHVRSVFRESSLDIRDAETPEGEPDGLGPLRVCRVDDRDVPLMDLSTFFAGEEGECPPTPACAGLPVAGGKRILLIRAGERELALRVDDIDRVVTLDAAGVMPLPPVFRGRSARWFPRVLRLENALALVVDPVGMMGGPGGDPGDLLRDIDMLAPEHQARLDAAIAGLLSPDRVADVMLDTLDRSIRASLKDQGRVVGDALSRLWA